MTPILENALSAFCFAIWAHCCATNKAIGEMAQRSRGEAERARTSLNRVWYTAFGEVDKTVTKTLGGGPILRAEDVVSSYAEPVAPCKLALTDSWDREGKDIIQHCL